MFYYRFPAEAAGGALSGAVGNWFMAKRSLRILKRVSNIPSLGICESCSTQFSADPRQLGQAGVQKQFNTHKCDSVKVGASVAKATGEKETVKAAKK